MTISKVKEIIIGLKECQENRVDGQNPKCDYDCDNCPLNYQQGTLGEQIEAYEKVLEILNGDLIFKKDIVDIIKKMPNDNPSYWNSCDVVDSQELLDDIDNVPTIIESNKEVEE